MSVSNGGLPSEDSATIFSTLPGQFPNLLEDGDQKIKTREFLDASAGVVILVERFGKVFTPVIYDMNGNIKKITVKYEEDRENYEFLEDMILKQKNVGQLLVVDALQWLRRALHFISRFFQSVIDDSDNNNNTQDLSIFVKNAYKETLERYHGWLGSQLFNILSRFTPNRQQLFYQLALEKHHKEDHVLRDMRQFTLRMSSCVQKLVDFYQEHDLETNDRV
ncbi:glycolipid transfer protein [Tribolium castaneum]|uniref:Pleckstrin homology domain-containing family A member 8-like Protein n=1 Tax=Tribolium castaneum TaxID=7070 RepID=D6X0Q8_TRICA|nr:Pleckstrin homology domain-containing family A member 8-like Protein [Tribolium castaneum]